MIVTFLPEDKENQDWKEAWQIKHNNKILRYFYTTHKIFYHIEIDTECAVLNSFDSCYE